MLSLLRNRAFWIGVFASVALAGGLLAYGALRGAGASGAGGQRSVQRPHLTSVQAVPAASSMSALNSTSMVSLPPPLSNDAAEMAHSGQEGSNSQTVGSIDTSQAHLLLDAVGSHGASVYAVATSRGDVCMFVTGGNTTCADQFNSRAPVVWVGSVSPASGTVSAIAGIAPDRVRGIALDEGGTAQQATLRNNAFFLEPSAYPDAIIVAYDDGTTQTVALPSQQQLKH